MNVQINEEFDIEIPQNPLLFTRGGGQLGMDLRVNAPFDFPECLLAAPKSTIFSPPASTVRGPSRHVASIRAHAQGGRVVCWERGYEV